MQSIKQSQLHPIATKQAKESDVRKIRYRARATKRSINERTLSSGDHELLSSEQGPTLLSQSHDWQSPEVSSRLSSRDRYRIKGTARGRHRSEMRVVQLVNESKNLM